MLCTSPTVVKVPPVTTMIVPMRSMEPPITEIREVVKPVVQEVVRDVVRKRNEAHTIVQQRPVVELVEKLVEVPQYLIEERHETVPVVIQHEQVVEVPEVTVLVLTTEVPLLEYQEAVVEVQVPNCVPVEALVEVPHVARKECLIEVICSACAVVVLLLATGVDS